MRPRPISGLPRATSASTSLARNIAEIEADAALRWYGSALALLQLVVWWQWQMVTSPVAILTGATDPICWPFLADCDAWRVLGPTGVHTVLLAHLGLALGAATGFRRRSWTALAWGFLLGAIVLEAAIVSQDYRLRANQHYMALWTSLVFLFVPGKRRVLPVLVMSFYVWAGTLKLDPDWLSGAALYGRQPLLVPAQWTTAACAYVLVLELVFVWGLLARSAWIFWLVFAQVLLFHLTSWSVVGFFYPLVMVAILTIFPLVRELPTERSRWRPAGIAVFGLFCTLQVAARLFPGDTAVTGEGRILALHMFDAPVACNPTATLHWRDGRVRTIPLSAAVPARIHCDPIVYLSVARAQCRRRQRDPGFEDLDLLLTAARVNQPPLRAIVSIPRFCAAHPVYRWWRHNDWIAAE